MDTRTLVLRKEGWTDFVFEVLDIGEWSFVGFLREMKTGRILFSGDNPYSVFKKDDDWLAVADAQEIINLLPVK